MKRLSWIPAVFLVATTAGHAQWEQALVAETEYAASLHDEGYKSQKAELTLLPEVRWRGERRRFKAVARLRGDGYDRLEPGRPEQPAVSEASQRHFHTDRVSSELREFWFELSPGDTWLRIGKQQVVWGQADGLKVLDVVNPQQFREFILPEFDDSRIPLWTVNWELPAGPGTVQLLWIPDRSYNDLPESDALFAFSSPLLVPRPPSGVPVRVRETQRPDDFFADADYGARWSAFLGGWDLTLNYLYHYHDNPVPFTEVDATGATVTPRYERTHLVGGTFTNAFGDFTLRNEMAVSTDRWFLAAPAETDTVLHSPEASWVFGLDWRGLADTLISGQVFQSAVDIASQRLVRDSVETDLTLLARRDFLYDTLTAEVIGIHNLNREDGLVRPRIAWEARSNLELSLGADLFYGDRSGRYGQFDGLDRGVVRIELGL